MASERLLRCRFCSSGPRRPPVTELPWASLRGGGSIFMTSAPGLRAAALPWAPPEQWSNPALEYALAVLSSGETSGCQGGFTHQSAGQRIGGLAVNVGRLAVNNGHLIAVGTLL